MKKLMMKHEGFGLFCRKAVFPAAALVVFLAGFSGGSLAEGSSDEMVYEAETFDGGELSGDEVLSSDEAGLSLTPELAGTDSGNSGGSAASGGSGQQEDSSFWADADGLIEAAGVNAPIADLAFEITDSEYWAEKEREAEEEARARQNTYGKLYPPAPLLEGINAFRQGDLRWGLHRYGYADGSCTVPATISSSGCGLLSLVNAVYYMTGCFIEPEELADWCCEHGYRMNGVGTVHALYQAYADVYGETYGFAYAGSAASLSQIRSFLHEEGSAIISTDHHLMAVVDYDPEKGGYLLLDSAPSSTRGTYPTGYRYLSEQDFAESIPIYAIMMLKKTGSGDASRKLLESADKMLQGGTLADPASYFDYVRQCSLRGQMLLSSGVILN